MRHILIANQIKKAYNYDEDLHVKNEKSEKQGFVPYRRSPPQAQES